jgi:hypothetical protein
MKSFKQYYNEGGNAVVASPIPQKYVKDTLSAIEKDMLKPLGLTKKGIDWETIGSVGKKKEDSGDIDILVNVLSLIKNNKKIETVDDIAPFIQSILKKQGFDYKYSKGLGVFSFQYPVVGQDSLVQLDLMLTDNMEYSVWAYWSPTSTETRFKKMGLYRNLLLASITTEMKKEILSKFDDGTPKEVKKYILAMDGGVYTKVLSYVGKKGQPVKSAKVLFQGEATKNVNEIVELLLGKGATQADTNSFESVWKRMMSKDFPYKNKINDIKKYAKTAFVNLGLPVPEELD